MGEAGFQVGGATMYDFYSSLTATTNDGGGGARGPKRGSNRSQTDD